MTAKKPDVLIIGSGLAGLYTALHIDPSLSVLFVTKESFDTSSSWLAQGGIAAAVSKDDTPEYHVEDTLAAGAGLCDAEAVRVLTAEGPEEIRRLIEMRVPFDLDEDGDLAITREGGHTRNRVVHAGGDATGRETVRVLTSLAAARANISYMCNCFVTDIALRDGEVYGVTALVDGIITSISARFVVLATGGLGQIYSRTTNPSVSTGDGIALAVRTGAELRDMEFIQFHPTGLYQPDTAGQTFLISEAVRGEGALLRNRAGERFLQNPMRELAPRDVVTREIVRETARTGEPCVWLDTSMIPEDRFSRRFPTIFGECNKHGIDTRLIPVCPVQHYQVGGIRVDLFARTNVPGLYAVGEVSCTGVHGANRLASNSMLECLVFGRRAAESINGSVRAQKCAFYEGVMRDKRATQGEADFVRRRIREICDRDAGVVRTASGLERGLRELKELELQDGDDRPWLEAKNMQITAEAVFSAAIERKESCGTHYRIEEAGKDV